ncbi:TetR/AcrR family transcriptional regulator [Lyngbya sp. PCC 8106]|uniref:TetR/AcrR family transcriptional regulator n=1 Tax=Lyngbya sp. (strain PCC 8106) TaxID=313612 RepID=UPI0000EAC0FB|nr:TetR/AcrR family transcriptional regulator [Lyngbya sp. PCC 8106]EAW35535.1 Transcriptional Regulator, TetR family protein [Lyngbya sp. PCC 8106]
MRKITNFEYSRPGYAEKADQILRGAMPEFLAHGYACTSMDKIAKSAGVSKQTLYSHFCDKDGLFTALVKRIASEKFRLVWSQPLKGQPDLVLRDLAHRIIENASEDEYLCFARLIIGESSKRPDLAEIFVQELIQPATVTLTEYLQDCPHLEINDPEAIARIFVGGLIHFIMVQNVLQGDKLMPMDSERLIDSLVDTIVKSGQQTRSQKNKPVNSIH